MRIDCTSQVASSICGHIDQLCHSSGKSHKLSWRVTDLTVHLWWFHGSKETVVKVSFTRLFYWLTAPAAIALMQDSWAWRKYWALQHTFYLQGKWLLNDNLTSLIWLIKGSLRMNLVWIIPHWIHWNTAQVFDLDAVGNTKLRQTHSLGFLEALFCLSETSESKTSELRMINFEAGPWHHAPNRKMSWRPGFFL